MRSDNDESGYKVRRLKKLLKLNNKKQIKGEVRVSSDHILTVKSVT